MSSLVVSPTTTELHQTYQLENPRTAPDGATLSPRAANVAELESITYGDPSAQPHVFLQMLDDQARMADAFTQFAETLVPCLAGLAVDRPSVVAQAFDLRNDDGRLRVIDTDMSPDDIAWLESRLNSHPSLSKLAANFNDSVVDTYGDTKHAYYTLRTSNGAIEDAIPGLPDTVDRDVKFMSLLRTVRDADCGHGDLGDYYREHRYELAATRVRDFIMSPDTYRATPSGDVVLAVRPRSSMGEWRA